MHEYLVSVIVMSTLLGLVNYLSYPGASEKSTKFAVSVLLMYTAMMPILSFVSYFSESDVEGIIENIRQEAENTEEGGEYLTVSEEAIKSAISKLISTEYGIAEENIKINIYGFDFEKMRADRITVILSGKGALSDSRGVENFVNELGIGECEVKIELG